MTQRERAQALLDRVPDDMLSYVEGVLERAARGEFEEPWVWEQITEDELTGEELARLRRGDADVAAGRVVRDEDLDAVLAERQRAPVAVPNG